MPRLYFDLADGNVVSEDGIGVDLPDAEKAGQEALVMLCQIAREQSLAGSPRDLQVLVKDEDRQPLFTASLSLRLDGFPPRRASPTPVPQAVASQVTSGS